MSRFLIALSCYVLLHQVLGMYDVLTPRTSGRDLVEAVCSKIESVCIFPDAKLMLRRIAYVETNDGLDAGTYAPGYYGGIWKVDERSFLATKNLSHFIYKKIKSDFNIDWQKVIWQDLVKPFYSGLAARLYLHSLSKNLPRAVNDQATFWATKYNINGQAFDFINKTNSYRKTCKGVADVVFIVDGSSSIEHSNFLLVKSFLKNVIKYLNIGQDPEQNTRVSVVQFSGITRLEFDFNNFTTLDAYEKAIDNIIYLNGGTQTDIALDYLADKVFQPSAGARGGDIPKIAIVLTDGASVDSRKTKEAAKKVHINNITTFVIGVGRSLNKLELSAIASDPDCKYLYNLNGFEELESLTEAIEKKTCEASSFEGTVKSSTVPTSDTTTVTTPKIEPITPERFTDVITIPKNESTTTFIPKNDTRNCRVVVSQNRNVIEISGQGQSTIYFSNITFPTPSFYDSKYEITYFKPAVVTFSEYDFNSDRHVYCSIVNEACKDAKLTFDPKENYIDPCQPDPCPCGYSCVRQLDGQFYCAEDMCNEVRSVSSGCNNPCIPTRAALQSPDYRFHPQMRRC